jgi:hypothetical protein
MYEPNGRREPNFNNNMSTAAVFWDIEKTFDTTWHSGLLCKLSELEFSTSLIKLISYFPSHCKFSVLVEGEMSGPKEMRAGVPQGSVLSPTLNNIYTNDDPQTSDIYLSLFAEDTSLYATDRKECFVVRKFQRGLTSMETWCERWNIKINEDETHGIYFSRSRRPPIFFFIILSGVRLSPLGTAATTGLLYQPQMIDDGDCGAIGGMKIGRGNRSTRRKPAPAPLCPPQIPLDQTRD